MQYQVVFAEDELLILQNTVQKIDRLGLGFRVAASAQTGVQALEKIEECNPSLLITDIRMPMMDGLELIERARETHPDLDRIILSGYADFEYAQRAAVNQTAPSAPSPTQRAQNRAIAALFQRSSWKSATYFFPLALER